MMGTVDISWVGLGASCLLVLVAIGVSAVQGLKLERRLVVASIRTILQLLLIGFVIGFIIEEHNPWMVIAAISIQLAIASWTSASLLERPLPGARLTALYALVPTYVIIVFVLMLLVIRHHPWWEPRILLPLGGMVLGNSLTGTVLAINRYRAALKGAREVVMARLALGVPWNLAVLEQRQEAAGAALLPTIASMLTVGVVAMPGMMTGQIIAGADALVAVKYQVVVMFMLAGAVALASSIALNLTVRRRKFEAY